MALDYTSAIGNLTDGLIAEAVVQTYTTPLGVYAWVIAIFAIMLLTYIKTQHTGLSSAIGLIIFSLAQYHVTIVSDKMFVIIITLGIAVTLFTFWNNK